MFEWCLPYHRFRPYPSSLGPNPGPGDFRPVNKGKTDSSSLLLRDRHARKRLFRALGGLQPGPSCAGRRCTEDRWWYMPLPQTFQRSGRSGNRVDGLPACISCSCTMRHRPGRTALMCLVRYTRSRDASSPLRLPAPVFIRRDGRAATGSTWPRSWHYNGGTSINPAGREDSCDRQHRAGAVPFSQ